MRKKDAEWYAYHAAYRAANRDEIRRKQAEWRKNNKELEKAITAAYREANRELLRERARVSYALHRDKRKAKAAEYKRKNPDKYRIYHANRSARTREGSISSNMVRLLMLIQNEKCNYCGADLKIKYHIDHIRPLSRGGKHEDDNIQLLCPQCNMDKSAMFEDEYIYKTVAPAFK